MNIGINTIAGGGWDGAWKSGVVGLATGAWSVTGGFGMAKGFGTASKLGKLAGKLGYQMIGTTSFSIGNNWASNKGQYFTTKTDKDTGFGSYAIFGYEDMSNNTFTHEMHHLWQSRAMNNLFWPTYSALGLSAILSGGRFIDDYNYYEQIAYANTWF